MEKLRHLLATAVLLGAAACADGVGPLADGGPRDELLASRVRGQPSNPQGETSLHSLRQAPTAPLLATYQVSFWAVKGQDRSVQVNYTNGHPFLWLSVPKHSLSRAPDGRPIRNGDSVLISLTIDSTKFSVQFDPSGLQFGTRAPATLMVWYGYADPDLDGDGDVDATDDSLRQQLSFWSQEAPTARWRKVTSGNDAAASWIWTALTHFSEYAVSW